MGMSPNILIRNETDGDAGAITAVTITAFRPLEISNHTEQFIGAALRAAGSLLRATFQQKDSAWSSYIPPSIHG
jgi:putative acetyltransferase